MKKKDVQIGATYLVKVAGNVVPVKITREHDNGGWEGTSVKTGKTIRIKSPQRLRKCLETARTARSGKSPKRSSETCATPGCRGEVHLTSLGQPMCKECWDRACDEAAAAGSAESQAEIAATVANAEAGNLAQGLVIPMASKRTRSGKSLLDVAAYILERNSGNSLRCQDMLNLAMASGLWKPGAGKTPANTLYSAILREMKTKGDTSRFAKAGPGEFTFAGKGA